jgi:hypothetical protein
MVSALVVTTCDALALTALQAGSTLELVNPLCASSLPDLPVYSPVLIRRFSMGYLRRN